MGDKFKIGDVWKTRGGDLMEILAIRPEIEQPIIGIRVTKGCKTALVNSYDADGCCYGTPSGSAASEWDLLTPAPKETLVNIYAGGVVVVADPTKYATKAKPVARVRVTYVEGQFDE